MKRVVPIIIGISIQMFLASSVLGQMTAQDHYKRAEDYFKQGRYNEAIAPLKEAMRIRPDFAEAHYNLGITYDKLKRYDDAIISYKEAIHIKPDYADAHYNLGVIYDDLDDGENAKFYMTKAQMLYEEQGNEEWAGYAFSNLKRFFSKYGGNPILPIDYSKSDKNSGEIWFKEQYRSY